MSFESSNGYDVHIIYDNPHPEVKIYYNDGWPDGYGRVTLSYDDLKKILKEMEKTK